MNISVDIKDVILNTKRLKLRMFKETDLLEFYKYASVPGVGEKAGWIHHKSISESKEILDLFIKNRNNFAICYNDHLIGSIGINNYNEKIYQEFNSLKGKDIGYVISKDYQNQGFATEALNAVIQYLFDELKLDFITASCGTFNKISYHVQMKCGFTHYKDDFYETSFGEIWPTHYQILKKIEVLYMGHIYVKNYQSILNLEETEEAIKLVKDTFERELSLNLDLTRVSAPLFLDPKTGLNDNLNGYEKAVGFHVHQTSDYLEIVQSLAKWKRNALSKYHFHGIYTDMNAIRPFEELDNIHSLYVDQWDWEKVISKEERNEEFLKETVRDIYKALLKTEEILHQKYPKLSHHLPNDITFIKTSELEDLYPNMSRKERENAIAKKYGAVFLMQIGYPLKDGAPHDGRAADYDDWSLNGDIILWYQPLEIAYEISSMGIRVNKESLLKQLAYKHEEEKLKMKYHQDIIENKLPLTIGGGIGQSRMCLFMLNKVHIGEVQASYWPKEEIEEFKKLNVFLL